MVKDLAEAGILYSEEGRMLLNVQCRLERLLLETTLFLNGKPSEQQTEEFCQKRKEEIDIIGEQYIFGSNAKISDEATIELFQRLRDENNSRIWKVFHNLFVFMRAAPKVSNKPSESVAVRRPNKLAAEIQKVLKCKELNLVGIFRVLTETNLRDLLRNGCLLLVLSLDVEEVDQKLYLKLEDPALPISKPIAVNDILSLFYTKSIDTIVLIGKNVAELASLIHGKASTQTHPTLVVFDTLIEDPAVDVAQEYFIRIKQQ